MMIEISGQEKKIEAFIEAVRPVRHPRAGPDRPDRPGPRQPSRLETGSRPPANPPRRPPPSWGIPVCDELTVIISSRTRRPESRLASRPGDRSADDRQPPMTDNSPRRPPMPATMYYDQDADLGLLEGQDDRHHRLREPGARAGAEPPRLGLQRRGRPAAGLGQLRPGRQARLQAGLGRRGRRGGRPGQHPPARRGPGRDLRPRHQAEPQAGQPAALLARVQHPLRPGRAARGGRSAPSSRPRGRDTSSAASSSRGAASPA